MNVSNRLNIALVVFGLLFLGGAILAMYLFQPSEKEEVIKDLPVTATATAPPPTQPAVTVSLRDELRGLGLGPLPPIVMPADNPLSDDKVELGTLLFFDPRMSGDGAVSCATCHTPGSGWGDGNALSLGYPGTLHWRNSQTILNSAYYRQLFWAGESKSLEAQAKSAWTGNVAGNLDAAMAEERLRQMPGYVRRFREVFGSDAPSFGDALRAVAAFEATITSRNAPFDQYMEGDDTALSSGAQSGAKLFVGKAGCIQCHGGSLFSDQDFHNTGVPPNPSLSPTLCGKSRSATSTGRGACRSPFTEAPTGTLASTTPPRGMKTRASSAPRHCERWSLPDRTCTTGPSRPLKKWSGSTTTEAETTRPRTPNCVPLG